MSFISESLTIGLLLAIVFGALFFYMYTRVTYNEKRVSLMENILLDIKMNQEQQPLHVLPPIPQNISFHETVTHEEETPTTFEIIEAEEEEEEYTELLNQVHEEVTQEEVKKEEVKVEEVKADLSNKYDSMTKEELVDLVKKRGLRAGNRPGREKLISLLEKADESTVVLDGGSFGDLQEAVTE